MATETIEIGSDFSGIGSLNEALKRNKISYKEVFSCDYDEYARRTFILLNGTAADLELVNSKEHKKHCKNVKDIIFYDYSKLIKNHKKLINFPTRLSKPLKIFIQNQITSQNKQEIIDNLKKEDELLLKSANEFAKKFSFYYPFNVYNREIPKKPLGIYVTTPPCQSFSLAGKRLGKEDKRGILFFNSLEFIDKNRPRYFKFENVKGLLSHDKQDPKAVYGRTFQEWINYLGGKSVNGVHTFFPYEDSVPYHIYFQVLNAKEYGVPQNRERVFIIGIRDDEDNNFQFPKTFPLKKRLKDVLETEVDEKYFLSKKMLEYFDTRSENFNNGKINYKEENDIASTITSSSSKSLDISDNILKLGNVHPSGNGMNGNVFSTEGIAPTLLTNKGEGIKIGTWRTHEDGKGFRQTEDNVCPTIPARAREDGSGQPVIKVNYPYNEQFKEIEESKILGYTRDEKGNVTKRHVKDVAGTLHTSSGGGGNTDQFVLVPSATKKGYEKAEEEEDSINLQQLDSTTRRGRVGKKVSNTLDTSCNQGILTKQRIRRLTPKECLRLMDFSEESINKILEYNINNPKKAISDSQLYKQSGNSIVVKMFELLTQKLNINK